MTQRRRTSAALAATLLLASACGGSEESATTDAPADDNVVETVVDTEPPATDPPATDPPATDPPATDPPATDPPVTDPPASNLPEWASGEFVIVESDTGPLELPVEIVPFCESSRAFYIAANGITLLDVNQELTFQQLLAALQALGPVVIESAPSDDFTAEPTAAVEQVNVIISALAEVDFDTTRLAEVSDPQAVGDALTGFGENRDLLRSFLVDTCGADGAILDQQSREAVTITAQEVGESVEPSESVEAVEGNAVANSAGTIELDVPTDWTETEETVVSDRDQLVASPDIASFFELEGAGVLVLRGEGGFRDGGFVGRVLDFESDLEKVGCELIEELGYQDSLYTGQERGYDCGSDGLEMRLLGGTTADESLYALVFVVHRADEPGVRQLIVDTFQVS